MVKTIATKAEFDAELKGAGDMLVVVDFTASWCGPCRMISPEVDNLAASNPDVLFIKVDIDENTETAQLCDIACMPTFKFYKNGKLLEDGTMEGANKDILIAKVARMKLQKQ